MYYICKKRENGTYGIMDTKDGIVEYYHPSVIIDMVFVQGIEIQGVFRTENGKIGISIFKPRDFETVSTEEFNSEVFNYDKSRQAINILRGKFYGSMSIAVRGAYAFEGIFNSMGVAIPKEWSGNFVKEDFSDCKFIVEATDVTMHTLAHLGESIYTPKIVVRVAMMRNNVFVKRLYITVLVCSEEVVVSQNDLDVVIECFKRIDTSSLKCRYRIDVINENEVNNDTSLLSDIKKEISSKVKQLVEMKVGVIHDDLHTFGSLLTELGINCDFKDFITKDVKEFEVNGVTCWLEEASYGVDTTHIRDTDCMRFRPYILYKLKATNPYSIMDIDNTPNYFELKVGLQDIARVTENNKASFEEVVKKYKGLTKLNYSKNLYYLRKI